MRLTHFSDYALRVLMYAAARGENLITIEETADVYGIFPCASDEGRKPAHPGRLPEKPSGEDRAVLRWPNARMRSVSAMLFAQPSRILLSSNALPLTTNA